MSGSGRRRLSELFDTLQASDDKQFVETVEAFLETEIVNSERAGAAFNLNHIKNKDGMTLLHLAVKSGHKDAVKFLLSYGANMEAIDGGVTPFHLLAIKSGIEGWNEIAETLYHHNTNIIACTDSFGNSPLWLAAADVGNLSMVKFLLDHGADVDKQNETRCDTPLHAAVRCRNYGQDAVKIVALLLDKGANPILQNKDGDTPLHVAVDGHASHDIIKELLRMESARRTCKIKNKNNKTPLDIAEQLKLPDRILDLLRNAHDDLPSQANPFMGRPVASDSEHHDNRGEQQPKLVNIFIDNKGGTLAVGDRSSIQNCGSPQQQSASADPQSPSFEQAVQSMKDMMTNTPSCSRSNSSAPENCSESESQATSPSTEYVTNVFGHGCTAVGDNSNISVSHSSSPGTTSPSLTSQASTESDQGSPRKTPDRSSSVESDGLNPMPSPSTHQVERT